MSFQVTSTLLILGQSCVELFLQDTALFLVTVKLLLQLVFFDLGVLSGDNSISELRPGLVEKSRLDVVVSLLLVVTLNPLHPDIFLTDDNLLKVLNFLTKLLLLEL